ncbi:tetratricopeptide repeat protein [Kordiimonas aquimaris]|uniref:tetratricopeptide repeat protein n=1 Tax=Kordiimonas aquimaris TaxID=707591 RepID=UPI0021CE0488|nr:tetratricopeptide repeat protein [Kordiimonas aquimaris]
MRGFVSLLGFAFVIVTSISAVQAQTSPAVMAAKIEALERQLRALQQNNYSARTGAPAAVQSATPVEVGDRRLLADLSAQLGTMERQLRQLNGRLEEYEYRQNQMSEAVEQLRNQMALQREQMLTLNAAEPSQPVTPPASSADNTINSQNETAPVTDAPVAIELPNGDAAVQYQYAFGFIQRNDLASGRIAMEQFMSANSDDARVPNAIFWLGRINMQQGNNADAARLFLSLVEDHPNHNRRVDALVDLADVLVDMNAPQDACNALAEFRRDEDKASDRLIARARRVSEAQSCNVF